MMHLFMIYLSNEYHLRKCNDTILIVTKRTDGRSSLRNATKKGR